MLCGTDKQTHSKIQSADAHQHRPQIQQNHKNFDSDKIVENKEEKNRAFVCKIVKQTNTHTLIKL